MRVLAASLLALALMPGCSSRDNYLVNRAADFSDILRFHVMAGPGIGLKLEATRLLHLGGVYTHNMYAFGWHNRAIGSWKESVKSWGLLVGHYSEETDPIPYYSGDYGWTFGDEGMGFSASDQGNDLDLLTFRGQLIFLIGVDLEVRVGEVLDFIAGIFQFDPAGDDRDYEAMRQPDYEPATDDAPDGGTVIEETPTGSPE